MYTEDRAKELRKDPHEPLPSKLQPAVQGGAKGLKHQQRFGDKQGQVTVSCAKGAALMRQQK